MHPSSHIAFQQYQECNWGTCGLALFVMLEVQHCLLWPSMHNPNQFTDFQNLFYNFFNRIFNVIFSPRFSVFEAHFQHYGKSRLQWISLHKFLNRKIIILHFLDHFFNLKTRLQKEFFKNIKY